MKKNLVELIIALMQLLIMVSVFLIGSIFLVSMVVYLFLS